MSDTGPQMIWPAPMTTNYTIRLACTSPVEAPMSLSIDGKAGRCMSIENGPTADNQRSTRAMRRKLECMNWYALNKLPGRAAQVRGTRWAARCRRAY